MKDNVGSDMYAQINSARPARKGK